MKLFKWTERSAVTILLSFSIFGLLMFGNILHEYSHKKDFEGIAYDDSFCFLEMPANITLKEIFVSKVAHYKFFYYPENQTQVDEINEYTEKKAYTYNVIIGIIFFVCFVIVFYNRLMKKEVKNELGNYNSPIETNAFDI